MANISSAQETLPISTDLAVATAADRLNKSWGIVHTADLEWPFFDPSEKTTMSEYLARIGLTMTDRPRESFVKDSALGLFRKDFEQAEPERMARDIYFPGHRGSKKGVVTINTHRRDFLRSDYPGSLPFDTGVAVSAEIYEELNRSGAYLSDRADNVTRRKRKDHPIVEEVDDLAGEATIYANAGKHEILEGRYQYLLDRYEILQATHDAIKAGSIHTVAEFEHMRLESMVDIMEMMRVVCRMRDYGTNQTHAIANAVASNLHRSSRSIEWWKVFTSLAMRYNLEIQGKVAQSIHVCIQEIGCHRQHAINNEFRIYNDDGSIQYES